MTRSRTGKVGGIRLAALLLAGVMVLTMLPAGVFTASAEAESMNISIENFNDLSLLGRCFNLLGSKNLCNDAIPNFSIFNSKITAEDLELIRAGGTSISKRDGQFTYISDVSTYMQDSGWDSGMDYGLDISALFKIEALDLSVGCGVKGNGTSSSETAKKTEYAIFDYTAVMEKRSIDLSSDKYIQRLWDYNMLNADFVDELTSMTAEALFAKYGTHIITGFAAGGEMHLVYKSSDFSSSVEGAEEWTQNVSVLGVDLNDIRSSSSNIESGSNTTVFHSYITGGTETGVSVAGLIDGTLSVDTWLSSISGNPEILLNDSLVLTPIWELLIDEKYADIRVDLENYYYRHIDAEYAELYGEYIYTPEENDSRFADYTFITSASGLNAIRNNLSGKYVLVCDIDLSALGEWTPIGTANAPFNGILDANGCTVSGLSITKTTDGAAGLFGYVGTDGEIRNLALKGSVQVDAQGNANNVAYVGGIAGYNKGLIENCNNMVTVDAQMTVTGAEDSQVRDGEHLVYDYDKILSQLTAANTYDLTTYTGSSIDLNNAYVVKLKGEAKGTLQLNLTTNSQTPIYIILEDAHFMNASSNGALHSSATRPIWLILEGEDNSIQNGSWGPGIYAPNAAISIVGDASLSVSGHQGRFGTNGSTGATGTAGNGGAGGVGKQGGAGGTGGDGYTGIICSSISLDTASTVTVTGGTGGTGGVGGTGGTGGNGARRDVWFSNAYDGGNGGIGGTGGAGGNGAYPVSLQSITVYSGYLKLVSGKGGKGGTGGQGGTGGKGGNSNAWGTIGGDGGDGGTSGAGGSGRYGTGVVAVNAIDVKSGALILVAGEDGASGGAGTGGNGGKAGCYDGGGSDSGQVRFGDDGDKGSSNGGQNGIVGGSATANSGITTYESTGIRGKMHTLRSQYTAYKQNVNYATAKSSAVSNGAQLVSIGSAEEQALVTMLTSSVGDYSAWMGLKLNTSTNRWNWEDGSSLYVPSQIDCDNSNGKYEFGKAYDSFDEVVYTNWSSGEPNNAGNGEDAGELRSDGQWNDNASTAVLSGYVTEALNSNATVSFTAEKNALMAGGVAGYNAREAIVTKCLNSGDITIDKLYSEKGGIAACAGGIAGVNSGILRHSANSGYIKAVAKSESMSDFAQAYAYEIAKFNGAEQTGCCISTTEKVGYCTVNAKSANALSYTHKTGDAADTPVEVTVPTATIKEMTAYWQNSIIGIQQVAKLEYVEGNELDTSTLQITYENQPVEKYTLRYYFLTPGCKLVKVSYGDYVRTFPVKVREATPVSLTLERQPKLEFQVGESFTASGMILNLNYDNGDVERASANNTQVAIQQPDMSTDGEKTVSVSYRGQNMTYSISVQQPQKKLFDLAGVNMALGNDLSMNLYVNASDVAEGDYYMEIVKTYADGRADAIKTVAMDDWMTYATMYYVSFDGVAAKEMTDEFYVTVYHADGTQASNTKVLSIADYAIGMLNRTDDASAASHNLMADMLDYGAAAQQSFKYAQSDLANANMTDAHKACGTQNFSMDQFTNGTVSGTGFMGGNLTLVSSICMNVYFDQSIVDNTMTAKVSYTDHNGKKVSYEIPGSEFFVLSGYGFIGVEITTMAAADAESMVTVEILDGDTVVASGSTSVEALSVHGYAATPLYVDLMKFCTAAYNFFH